MKMTTAQTLFALPSAEVARQEAARLSVKTKVFEHATFYGFRDSSVLRVDAIRAGEYHVQVSSFSNRV
jgi:predicted transcriptional regulator